MNMPKMHMLWISILNTFYSINDRSEWCFGQCNRSPQIWLIIMWRVEWIFSVFYNVFYFECFVWSVFSSNKLWYLDVANIFVENKLFVRGIKGELRICSNSIWIQKALFVSTSIRFVERKSLDAFISNLSTFQISLNSKKSMIFIRLYFSYIFKVFRCLVNSHSGKNCIWCLEINYLVC